MTSSGRSRGAARSGTLKGLIPHFDRQNFPKVASSGLDTPKGLPHPCKNPGSTTARCYLTYLYAFVLLSLILFLQVLLFKRNLIMYSNNSWDFKRIHDISAHIETILLPDEIHLVQFIVIICIKHIHEITCIVNVYNVRGIHLLNRLKCIYCGIFHKAVAVTEI